MLVTHVNGIFFLLKTGIHWYSLPKEFGAPTTIHCKFRNWVKLGVYKEIMKKLQKFIAQIKKITTLVMQLIFHHVSHHLDTIGLEKIQLYHIYIIYRKNLT